MSKTKHSETNEEEERKKKHKQASRNTTQIQKKTGREIKRIVVIEFRIHFRKR